MNGPMLIAGLTPRDIYNIVLTVKIAGPWERQDRRWLRRSLTMKTVATVFKAPILEEPAQWRYVFKYDDFTGEPLVWNEDEYEADIQAFNVAQGLWKPWVWKTLKSEGYASSFEEAVAIAEEHLRSEDWILAED